MSILFIVDYRNRLVSLDDLAERLTDDRWEVYKSPPRAYEMPQAAGHTRPAEVVVCDRGSSLCAHFSFEVANPAGSRYAFSLGHDRHKAIFVGKVLMAALDVPDTWLVRDEEPQSQVYGPTFVQRMRENPDWYWGYDFEQPEPPFELAPEARQSNS